MLVWPANCRSTDGRDHPEPSRLVCGSVSWSVAESDLVRSARQARSGSLNGD